MTVIDDILARFPKVSLGYLPTPLEHLPRLSRHLGGPEIWVKRDDCTGLGMGGNKVRKLEYLMGDAKAGNHDTIITSGAIQSNHARLTAAAAAKLGHGCVLVLTDSVPGMGTAYKQSGNLLLDRVFGAEVHIVPGETDTTKAMETVAEDLRRKNHSPYIVPIGGSNEIGALGYVAAAGELVEQCRHQGLSFNSIMLPTASAGTHVGLLLGLALQRISVEVIGFSVGRKREEQTIKVETLIKQTSALLQRSLPLDYGAILVDDGFTGPGYGQPTPEMMAAVRLVAEKEGLILDPVYSGKAMAGLIAFIRQRRWTNAESVIFLHTGGSASLFAYDDVFTKTGAA